MFTIVKFYLFTFVIQLEQMDLHTLKNLFKIHKELHLFGRYITLEHLAPLIQKHRGNFKIETIGNSVLGDPIHSIIIGSGRKKILMWSQMHGNESTTTKAVFDLLNVFAHSDLKEIQNILNTCTIGILPMLNSDGAKAYTRVNANQVDLNRDAQGRSQPESRALRAFFEKFGPEFCFNLHGQRTIFSAGKVNYPATVSFLAPSQDQACTVTDTRKKAMDLIVRMNQNLQQQIPNQVGRYDDDFNLNCVGDTFQSLNVPTVLFEAGHYQNDFNREVVREFLFQSLLVGIHFIATNNSTDEMHDGYEEIPQNQKLFYDIIIRNARVEDRTCDIAIQYQERLVGQNIQFVPMVEKISDLKDFYGHKEVDCNNAVVSAGDKKIIYEGYENDFVLMNSELFSIKL